MKPDWFQYILSLKGYPISPASAELKRIQSLDAGTFADWQMVQAWSIARYHYEYNPFYKKKVGKVFPDRWEDLPVITKRDLQQPLAGIITNNTRLRDCYISSTSGSSGTPFYFAKDKYAHAITWAVIADRYSWYGLYGTDLQARFYGMPKETIAHAKEQWKDILMHRKRFNVFDLSTQALQLYVQQFAKNKFRYIYGYTNALLLFARHLNSIGVRLKEVCPSLTLCISTSEIATPEDHFLFQKAFGVPHVREYGVSETCLTGFDHPSGNWLLTEETLYNEVVDFNNKIVSPGVSGALLSTSLFNKALPMVRYQVGDTIQLLPSTPGSKYRIIESMQGRTTDTIRLPSGKVAAGLAFYYIARGLLEKTDCLKEFIIRQTALNRFVFDIVSDRPLTQEETNEIKNKTALYLEPGLDVVINRVPYIKRTAAGKLKNFYSELAAFEKDSNTNTIFPS